MSKEAKYEAERFPELFSSAALSEGRAYDKIDNMEELIKNEIMEAEIEGWSAEAWGVCRIRGRAVFVPRAIPVVEAATACVLLDMLLD